MPPNRCPHCGHRLDGQEQLPSAPGAIPRAREGDPDTSHAAARSVSELRPRQLAILRCLQSTGPVTDERLVVEYDKRISWAGSYQPWPEQTAQSIRSRRAELVRAGWVRWTGEKRRMSTGRLARTWEAVYLQGEQTALGEVA